MLPQHRRLLSKGVGMLRRRPHSGTATIAMLDSRIPDRYHHLNNGSPYRMNTYRRSSSSNDTNTTTSSLDLLQRETVESTAAAQQQKDDDAAADQIDLLQKRQVVNELRLQDIKRRVALCKKNFRRPHSTLYDTVQEAMDAAQLYATQSNQSTLQEIQHWPRYTEPQVLDFFHHLSSRYILNEKEFLLLLDSYQQFLHTTSIFVVRKKGRRPNHAAVTHYPRSSLTLLTLLKGLHNAAAQEDSAPAALIHFLLHRTPHAGAFHPTPSTMDAVEHHAHAATEDVERRPPPHQPFHQSMPDYERMMHCLEQARARMDLETYWQAQKKAGQDPEHDATGPSTARRDKTVQLASHLAYHLPCSLYQNVMDFLTDWTRSRTAHMRRVSTVERIPIRDVLGIMYYPLVVRQLADYLFHSFSDDTAAPSNGATSGQAAAIYPYCSHQMFLTESHRTYRTFQSKRTAVQNKFVAVVMGVQHALWHGSPVIVMGEKEASLKFPTEIKPLAVPPSTAKATVVPDRSTVEGADEPTETIPEEEVKNLVPLTATLLRQRRKLEVHQVETLEESEIRPVAIRKQKKAARVGWKPAHVAFEAIALQIPVSDAVASATTPETSPMQSVAPLNGGALNGAAVERSVHHGHVSNASASFHSRMVFIDNLPIDIQEDRITEVFSRCGDIEALTIYNRRPDLDPGPLPLAELAQRRSRQTKVTLSERKWQRPKTPVYGLITFATDDGARKAMDESLRIFGMILQRHPVRSVPSWTMTKLFIEDIPEGPPCVEFEYLLSHALEPNVFVCLDAGQDVKSSVTSCEIKFPSFAMAFQSYLELQRKLSILGPPPTVAESDATTAEDLPPPCRINWMRTEKDAVKWWTRDYGFD